MSDGILGADRGLEWHRAVAPGVEVTEITTHGLALSSPRRGFEPRWGHHNRRGVRIAPPTPPTCGPDETFTTRPTISTRIFIFDSLNGPRHNRVTPARNGGSWSASLG